MNNPPSLRLLSVSRIRESLSCMGQDVEKNLIEKLTVGDLHELSNPNVPVSLGDICKYSSVIKSLLFNYFFLYKDILYLTSDFIEILLVPIIKSKTGDASDKNDYRPIA